MIKFVLNRGLSRPLFYSRVPAMEHLPNLQRSEKGYEGNAGKIMVILITGASHTGKTMLAQKMLEKHGYTYLSIDHLKMGLIRSCKTDWFLLVWR